MLHRLMLKAKHRFRLSPLASPYWRRRRAKLARTGSYAQHGEDRILLERCGPNGTYLDIGANHPFLISNTYLLYLAGWRGVTVEPIRSLWMMHRRWRPRDIALNAAVGTGEALHFHEICPDVLSTLSQETAREIERRGDGVIVGDYDVALVSGDEIMRTLFPDAPPTLLSIDVEGAELGVLRSFDFARARPALILVEHHSFIPDDAASESVQRFLTDAGYALDQVIGANSLYRAV